MSLLTMIIVPAMLSGAGVAAQDLPVTLEGGPVTAPLNGDDRLVFLPEFFAAQRPNTALDMASRVPGFTVVNGDGSRGFEGSVGNVLVNGARSPSKTETASTLLSRIPASQVERVELIRGGAAGIDMQGFGLVVNVVTKATASRQSTLTTSAILFDGGSDMYGAIYQFTAQAGETSWGVTLTDDTAVEDSNGAGSAVRRSSTGAVLQREAYFDDRAGGGSSIQGNLRAPAFRGRVEVTGRYGSDDSHDVSLQTAPAVRRENLYEEDELGGDFGLIFTRGMGLRSSFESRFIHEFAEFETLSTARTHVAGVDDPEQRFSSEGRSAETILRALVKHDYATDVALEFGGEVAFNRLETDQAFTIGGISVPLPSASVTVSELRGEAFGKGVWRASPTLSLEGGVRLEASTIRQTGDAAQEKTFVFPKPRMLAIWSPSPEHQFRFRVERDVGQLDFADFAASSDLDDDNVLGGNVDLEPEQRWIVETAYERRFWDDGVVSLTYRHDEIDDAIDVIPLEGGLSAVGNIGHATLDQLIANIAVPLDRIGFSGGRVGFRNTWNHTRVDDPTTGERRALSGIRPSQATFIVGQDIASWKLQWGAVYVAKISRTDYGPDQINSFRGVSYIEMYTEYRPTPTLALRAQLNLWDDFETQRTVFSERASGRPVSYTVNRYIDPRTFVTLRLRKTF